MVGGALKAAEGFGFFSFRKASCSGRYGCTQTRLLYQKAGSWLYVYSSGQARVASSGTELPWECQ